VPGSTFKATVNAWILAARPRTLTAAWTPVIVGAAVAWRDGTFRPVPAAAALLGATLIQIGTNFANDYYDFIKGADAPGRLGPTRATAAGLLKPEAMFRGMLIAFGLAFVVGIYLVSVAGWPIVVLGLLSLLCGWAYTGGPFPLAYNGLGDVFVFLFFGVGAVAGTYFVQAESLSAWALAASVPVGALATAIIAVNNLRDADTDVLANKRTLAVRFGRKAVRIEYTGLLAVAWSSTVAMAVVDKSAWHLLPLLAVPLAKRSLTSVWTITGRPLNQTLGDTAKLLAIHGVLQAAGLMLSRS
jgi:1,4-dihydroxy-2-naphthoate octaprenyltransferase